MSTTPRRRTGANKVVRLLDGLERLSWADPVIDVVGRGIRALPLGDGRDLLHGRWLGHPLHPLLVQVPIGSWLSAAVLDLWPGRSREAGLLIGLGTAAAAPAALSGAVDWAELRPRQQRVGLVHALANTAAVGLYAASLACRARGAKGAGRAFGFLGLTVAGTGGLLGGHLAYRQASGANHAEEVPSLLGEDWYRAGAVAEFPAGRPVRRTVQDVPVLIVRDDDGTLRALADRCSHLAGPLSEGTVADGCVRCPWHGSVFRLSDGWNVSGPATAPQPAFETRVTGGQVEIRLRDQVPGQPADDSADTDTEQEAPHGRSG
ncbi:Rieske (2Fe-2S) protein [Streptomyces capoamus]|uniref:Rieske (2Fe-2S) protein n=1 Tax=Streptomyces capoamus TaxID=68183 RepID=UPI00167A7012|nr:Rieske (2Fe-2S) protein [Streptomyces capoamus]